MPLNGSLFNLHQLTKYLWLFLVISGSFLGDLENQNFILITEIFRINFLFALILLDILFFHVSLNSRTRYSIAWLGLWSNNIGHAKLGWFFLKWVSFSNIALKVFESAFLHNFGFWTAIFYKMCPIFVSSPSHHIKNSQFPLNCSLLRKSHPYFAYQILIVHNQSHGNIHTFWFFWFCKRIFVWVPAKDLSAWIFWVNF